jgi:hypothetical protein
MRGSLHCGGKGAASGRDDEGENRVPLRQAQGPVEMTRENKADAGVSPLRRQRRRLRSR